MNDDDLLARALENELTPEEEAALAGRLKADPALARRILELRYGDKADVPRISREVGRTVQASYAILKRTKQLLKECIDRRLSGAT